MIGRAAVVDFRTRTGNDGAMRGFGVMAAVVVLAVGGVSGCSASVEVGGTPEPTTTTGGVALTETLVNDQYGFSFGYSPPFEPQADTEFSGGGGADSTTTEAVFDTEGAQIGGQYRDAFVVNVYPLPAEVTADDLPDARAELENTVIPQLKASTPGMTVSPLTDTTVAGRPAFTADVSFDVDGQPIESTMYFVFEGKAEYQILTQAAKKNWDGLQPTFESMLASFTIDAATATPTA